MERPQAVASQLADELPSKGNYPAQRGKHEDDGSERPGNGGAFSAVRLCGKEHQGAEEGKKKRGR